VAQYLSQPGIKLSKASTRLIIAAMILIPAALIMLQPDTGTVLVFAAFIFALYREGLSGNVLIAGFGGIVLSSVAILLSYSQFDYPFIGEGSGIILLNIILIAIGILAWMLIRSFILPRNRKRAYITVALSIIGAILFVSTVNFAMDEVLQKHQKKRIEILFGLDDDPQGAGYNVKQSKTAIGSGGWAGKGYLQGPFTKYGFVPEQSTDFIFCTVGEEWGFLGSSIVLIVFAALIIRIIIISERQRSTFSRIYGYCAASILFFHLLINIGMVIGLAPVIGIPLPFFSYGGSSLMGFTILLSIMLRLDAERLSVLR
jgi:rod shape determining protein RodA